MCVYEYVYVCVCMCVCVFGQCACMRSLVCMYMYESVCVCVCLYLCMYVCMYVRMHVCMYVYSVQAKIVKLLNFIFSVACPQERAHFRRQCDENR